MPVLGMPTLIEIRSLEECAALCQLLKLDFIELNMNLPQYQLSLLKPDHLMMLSDRYGIGFTIHMDENLNAADFNSYVAEAYRRTVLETIDLARHIHAPILNMHLPRGVYFTLPGKKVFLFEEYCDAYLSSMRVFRDECTARIGSEPILIAVENTNGFLPFQLEALELLLESPCFALTLDTGHSHCSGRIDESFILNHRNRLRHMHLHDARNKADHLALGTGEADIAGYLQTAESNRCRIVLETKTAEGLRQSAEWMHSHRGLI